MKKIIATLLFTLFIGVLTASAQTEYCFENKGLKNQVIISFAVSGNKVTDGELQTSGYDESTSGELYHFKGTKTGNVLTIKFTGSIPAGFEKIKKYVWTLGSKTLKVQMYGKNYNTNKWSIYSATYEKCSE